MGSAVLVEPGVPERLSIAEELLPEDYIVDTLEAVQGAGIYVRGFTWNGQRAPNRTVNFGDEMKDGHLRILVAGDGAAVSLRVASRTGDPTANAYVALIPESAASEADIAASMIFGQTDQNGYYFAGAVPPGRYRILATNDPIDGAVCKLWGWPTDLAANLVSRLRDVRGRGQAVDIRPNSTVHLTLAPQSLQ